MDEQRNARLLIAEDEANLRLVLQKELQRLGYRVHVAPDGEAALRKLEESNVDVLLCDINMPRMDGMELLRRVHERPNPPEVIMLTGQGTIETAVEAMKNGANDYLTKPYSISELDVRVRQAAEKRNLRVDNQRLRAQIERKTALPEIVGQSEAVAEAIRLVERVAPSDASVLITGESGTGKELVARAIHALSSRRDKIFVPFNCTAVPKELSEGYLFGYRRGAFTGAVKDSDGVIRTAAGGTLFLDEIGDLPLDVQPKLLRFLQEGEIQPLGEQRPVKVDVRIIAATNTDLEEMVAQGRFREDLYYRLNVIRLRVPPLRERRSEIPTIVNYYVNHYSAKFGRRDIQIAPQAVDLLMVADWPGNVRQLCNEVQRVVARAEDGALITPEQLSPELRTMSAVGTPANVASIGFGHDATVAVPANATLNEALAEVEQKMIREAMQRHRGNISRAARELGLTRRGLYLKLDRYQISASA